MSTEQSVLEILGRLLELRDQPPKRILPESPLFTEGLNLDSVEITELAAMLEQEMGRDPFTDGELPTTVADVIAYYDR